ncbi:uncharacterized protein LOC102458195 isoform X3 [Pelodiscus sinensis]|uniref:uncharacterized protein LOC102458195 isoform X3 n=1 Tax=Pelodiscus sinensis TaxID=13735 RepID=UPI003F6B618D
MALRPQGSGLPQGKPKKPQLQLQGSSYVGGLPGKDFGAEKPFSQFQSPTLFSASGVRFDKTRLNFSAASWDVFPPLDVQALGLQSRALQAVTVERTDPEKMQKLYELVPSWDARGKSLLRLALKATNRALVEELEGGHFVEWPREQLIQRACLVDEILALLCGAALDREQYLELCTEPGKMRKLYELVPSWDTRRKDRLYRALKDTNQTLVKELEAFHSPREHFVERHREQLIRRVSPVDPALSLLREETLDDHQYWSIMATSSDPGRMQRLYELVPSWDAREKDKLYGVLAITNPALIKELEVPLCPEEHFVKRHQEQLIQRASSVRTVLDLLCGDVLSNKQYLSIWAERSDPQRMRKLYELVPNWDTLHKDRLYRALAATNPGLVIELEGEHFVTRHRQQLTRQVSRVDEVLARLRGDVLEDEQYRSVRTDPVRMRRLFELVLRWDTRRKDRLYQALKATEGALIDELEAGPFPLWPPAFSPAGAGGCDQESPVQRTGAGATGEHFVERHQEQLIERVSSVDKVLDLLRRDVLEPEEYRSIRTNPETMRRLYELVQTRDRTFKDRLYQTMKKRNRALIEELEGEHFVDQHREPLIQRVSNMDQVLRQLPLNPGQREGIMAEDSDSEKMRKLYKLLPSWDGERKDQLYELLKQTNGALIEVLEEGHFVDRHRERLIQRVANVEALCRKVLSKEQCRSVVTDPLKMWRLYELVPSWDTGRKDQLYRALKETNRALVEELEGKPFVDRHREQLIQRVSQVNQVLSFLLGKMLNKRQLQAIRTKQRHRELLWGMPSPYPELQGPRDTSLEIGGLIKLPEEQGIYTRHGYHVQKWGPYDNIGPRAAGDLWEEAELVPSPLVAMKAAGSSVSQQTHRPSPGSAAGAAGETRRNPTPTACLRGQNKCDWCAREEEDLAVEVKPESIQEPEGDQEMYRVHFSQPGWFRCPETELKFEVRAAVTVQYGYSSWRQHLTESLERKWMVAGPLFDIRVVPAEAVVAVHLPHFLCLRGADRSRVQIAHFLEEGMTLQSPTWVRPFDAVLQKPRFSPIGVIWRKIKTMKKKKSLIHSLVLLYQAQKRVNLTLHLYLIPSDGSRIKAVEAYEDKCRSRFVSKSHFTTRPLCFGACCAVSSPSAITVTPKELPFLNTHADAPQPFTEIHTKAIENQLELSLVEKNDVEPIWEAVLRPEPSHN